MKAFFKGTLKFFGGLILFCVLMVGLIFVAGFAAQIQNAHYDANTRIENATVVAKEKTSGTRRSLPRYYLEITDSNSSEPYRVYVDLGIWTFCEVGLEYNDIPGSPGRCEREITQIKAPQWNPIEIPSFDEDYYIRDDLTIPEP